VYKVLILPCSRALSNQEVQAISRFVQQGGRLVADLPLGEWDEQGRRRSCGALDEVLGIAYTKMENGKWKTGIRSNFQFPISNLHTWGQGQGVLLNMDPGQISPTDRSAWRTVLRTVFGQMGATPRIRGSKTGPGEVLPWRDGAAWYLGLLRPVGAGLRASPSEWTVEWDRPRQVYEVRSGQYVGLHQRLTVQMDPGQVHVYALLPGPVKVSLTAAERVSMGERVRVQVKVEANWAGKHVLHLEVKDPTGRPVPHYAQNILVTGNRAETVLPLAWNELPGGWTLRVRDVATGASASQKLEVE
jgi:hypothetical protein